MHQKISIVISNSKKDKKALIEAVKMGTIDCIATDHAPHTIEEKEGTFDIAPFGMIGLESCFGAVNKVLTKDNKISHLELIKLLTVNPRKIMDFNGDLFSLDAEAEITVLDDKQEWEFSLKDIESKSVNSPFIGKLLTGKVLYTLSKNVLASI